MLLAGREIIEEALLYTPFAALLLFEAFFALPPDDDDDDGFRAVGFRADLRSRDETEPEGNKPMMDGELVLFSTRRTNKTDDARREP